MRSPFKDAIFRDGLGEFYLFLSFLTALCLATVWGLRFPPLQDYPMTLFVGFASATFEDPSHNWPQFFNLENGYGSYSFVFWFLRVLIPIFGINAAGKLFLSLYVCAVAAFAAFEARGKKFIPWPLLLFIPLAFNQTYIIGLMGYLISIPFLLFALRHLEFTANNPLTPRRLFFHCFFQFLVFLAHPFTAVLYSVFSAIGFAFKRGIALLRSVFLVGGFTAFFVVWHLMSDSGEGEIYLTWWSFSAIFEFFLLMFAGMKINGGADWISVALWFCIFAFLGYSAFRMRGKISVPQRDTALLIAAAAGFFVLPFSPSSPYTYFNIRLVALVYFFAAVVVSNIGMCRAAGRVFAVMVTATVVWQSVLHYKLSHEIAQARPVILQMEKNSVILPVVADGRSAHLDPLYFYQFHSHVPEYYHLLVGGGASPYLIGNPAFPIKYRHPQRMLEVLKSRYWEDYACCYRYVLARGEDYVSKQSLGPFREVARSGLWSLFEAGGR